MWGPLEPRVFPLQTNETIVVCHIHPSKHPSLGSHQYQALKGNVLFGLDLILPPADCLWLSAARSLSPAGGGRYP